MQGIHVAPVLKENRRAIAAMSLGFEVSSYHPLPLQRAHETPRCHAGQEVALKWSEHALPRVSVIVAQQPTIAHNTSYDTAQQTPHHCTIQTTMSHNTSHTTAHAGTVVLWLNGPDPVDDMPRLHPTGRKCRKDTCPVVHTTTRWGWRLPLAAAMLMRLLHQHRSSKVCGTRPLSPLESTYAPIPPPHL